MINGGIDDTDRQNLFGKTRFLDTGIKKARNQTDASFTMKNLTIRITQPWPLPLPQQQVPPQQEPLPSSPRREQQPQP